MAWSITSSVHLHSGSGGDVSGTLATVNAGDIVIFVGYVSGATPSGATVGGAAATLRKQTINSGNSVSYYYLAAAAAGSDVAVAIATGGTAWTTFDVFAVGGANTSSPFDTNPSLPSAGFASGASSETISTSATDTLVFGGFSVATASPAAPAPWTTVSGADYQLTEYDTFTSPQTNLAVPVDGGDTLNTWMIDALVAAGPVTPVALTAYLSG